MTPCLGAGSLLDLPESAVSYLVRSSAAKVGRLDHQLRSQRSNSVVSALNFSAYRPVKKLAR